MFVLIVLICLFIQDSPHDFLLVNKKMVFPKNVISIGKLNYDEIGYFQEIC